MGGVVSDVVSGVGDIGQGAINAVSDLGVSIDQGVRNTLGPQGWTLAALMAAGYYYAPEIGAYVSSTTGETVPLAAVSDAGAVATPVTSGTVTATQLPALGTTAAGSAAGTALANAAAPAATPAGPPPMIVKSYIIVWIFYHRSRFNGHCAT